MDILLDQLAGVLCGITLILSILILINWMPTKHDRIFTNNVRKQKQLMRKKRKLKKEKKKKKKELAEI